MTITTDRKLLLSLSAGLIFFTLSGGLMGRVVAVEGTYSYLKLFNEVLYLVVNNYVQPADMDALMDGAYRGMLETLDPANEYMPPARYQKAHQGENGGPAGIGINLTKRRGYVVVVSVAPGSPAFEAGLRSGDTLISIDGRSTRSMGAWEAAYSLRGRPGSTLALVVSEVSGSGRQTRVLTRRTMRPGAPSGTLLPPGVGVVRLSSLNEGDAKRLDQAIANLRSGGADRLLLDLRGCATDSLAEAIGVASLFIAQGPIVTVTDRYEGDRLYRADGRKIAWDGPLAVLVDEGTWRGCEVIAAALRDGRGATLLGQRTWGAGTLQKLLPLRNDDGVLLAVGKFLSPSGKEWNGKGIDPDLTIDGDERDEGDPQRLKAIDYLRGMSPSASRKVA